MYGTLPGGDALPVADYDKVKLKFGNRLDVAKMFAPAFTLACCLLFLVPTIMIIYIVRNPVVNYFNGYWCYILLVNPVIIFAVHMVHVQKQAPSKWGVICALCIPSLLLLIVADANVMHAHDMKSRLMSASCDAYGQKAQLQRSWEAGYNAFMQCVNQTGVASNVPNELIMQNFRLLDCSEYSALAAKQKGPGWEYLQYLEEQQGCSGWCYPAQQLWATGPSKDSCSMVVSSAFRYFVAPHANEVMWMMVYTLFATAIAMVFLGPHMRNMGYTDW